MSAELQRPWWERHWPVFTSRDDASVPGGVILTPRDQTNAQLTVPSDAPPFSVELAASTRLAIVTEGVESTIGVVLTADRAHLSVMSAPAAAIPDQVASVDLKVVGRSQHPNSAGVTLASSGHVRITHVAAERAVVIAEGSIPEITLDNAGYVCRDRLAGMGVDAYTRGPCSIDVDAPLALHLAKGSRVALVGRTLVQTVSRATDAEITLVPGEQPATDAALELHDGAGLRIVADRGVVRVLGLCTNLEVVGGSVDVREDARVRGLALVPGAALPILRVRSRATAEMVSGRASLGECRHGRVTGAPDTPLTIDSVAADPYQPDKPQWTEAIISGVRIPDGLAAVPVLLAARDATIFDPDLRDLLPFERTYKTWFRSDRHLSTREVYDPIADSSRADLIAEVTAERSTQGSIRTRAAHAAYRMRQVTASSRWERWLLAAYRPFGYAQRPGPPLALWLLVTAAAVPLVAISAAIDPSGRLEWLRLAAEVLFLPFQVLRLNPDDGTELSKLDPVVLVPLRVALTLPFGFAVLAVRQFVKAGTS